MTITRGMTIQQFNDIIADMKKVYPFKDDEARLGSMLEMKSLEINHVEVHTEDKATGVYIVMQKGADSDND